MAQNEKNLEDDDGLFVAQTVPPPPGTSDAYSAPTRVGPVNDVLMEEMVIAAKHKAEEKRALAARASGERVALAVRKSMAGRPPRPDPRVEPSDSSPPPPSQLQQAIGRTISGARPVLASPESSPGASPESSRPSPTPELEAPRAAERPLLELVPPSMKAPEIAGAAHPEASAPLPISIAPIAPPAFVAPPVFTAPPALVAPAALVVPTPAPAPQPAPFQELAAPALALPPPSIDLQAVHHAHDHAHEELPWRMAPMRTPQRAEPASSRIAFPRARVIAIAIPIVILVSLALYVLAHALTR